MMNFKAGLLAAALALSAGIGASAKTYDITYTGVVGQLTDTLGYFGAVTPGETPFSATFIVDFSKGFFSADGGGGGGSENLIGGSSYTNLPTMSGTALSPVSAVLTVNGKALYFAGQNNGIDQSFYNIDFAPPQAVILSNNNQLASDVATASNPNSDDISGYVATSGPDNTSTGGSNPRDIVPSDLMTPYYLAIDGTVVTGGLSFDYSTFDAFGGAVIDASGAFNPTAVRVTLASGAPEPSTWALLVAGVGLAGGALRSRRRRTPSLAS